MHPVLSPESLLAAVHRADGGEPRPAGGGPMQVERHPRQVEGRQSKASPQVACLDMEQMAAQLTQTAIQNQNSDVPGRVDGDCSGNVRVDVIDTSNLGGPTEGGLGGPITPLFDAPGDFQVAIPKGRSVNLTALCDGDKDEKSRLSQTNSSWCSTGRGGSDTAKLSLCLRPFSLL